MILSGKPGSLRNGRDAFRGTARWRVLTVICFVLLIQAFCSFSVFAADAAVSGRYQVVTGTNDNAYLVNTETGAVWVLTYRTMATGREPVAIPYKFIGISPKTKGEFIVEAAPVPPPPKDRD